MGNHNMSRHWMLFWPQRQWVIERQISLWSQWIPQLFLRRYILQRWSKETWRPTIYHDFCSEPSHIIWGRSASPATNPCPWQLVLIIKSQQLNSSKWVWPKPGSLTLEFISKKCTSLFKRLGFLSLPVDFDLDPNVEPIHAPIHWRPISKLEAAG